MKAKTAFIFAVLITIFSAQALAQTLNLLDHKYGWLSPNPKAKIQFLTDKLVISSKKSSGGLYNNIPFNFSTNKHDLVIIEMKTSRSSIGEISWLVDNKGFSKERSLLFFTSKPGKFHTYYIDLKSYAGSKVIKKLLLFPLAGPGTTEIRTFKAVNASFPQKIIAGWQEFWGPQGRTPSGKDFLVIEPVRLFNRSIFYYLNWLIALAIVISLVRRQPKLAIGFILALWCLLEASSAVNNWHYFQKDRKFWGKSLEEKRTIQNVRDFYGFIKFAKKKMPADSTFTLITDPKYPFSVRRASYYLYPRQWSKHGSYLLLFDKLPNKNIAKDHVLIGKFREGAYIFKRK